MRARDFATGLLEATTLAGKLAPPPAELELDDDGPAVSIPAGARGASPESGLGPAPLRAGIPSAPARPPELRIAPGRSVTVPPLAGMRDPAQRARILHALANHELQAAELFAWALLAFPDAPRGFRAGLVGILRDEQRHCGLYLERLAAHGLRFGDCPVTGHFWGKLDQLATPLGFVCAMGLTFENANLDFAGEYARAARAAGDDETARVLEVVHDDEIGHVRFAVTWLGKLAPGRDPFEVYASTVTFPLGVARARGASFDADARRRAGLDEGFIAALAAAAPKRPGGGPR